MKEDALFGPVVAHTTPATVFTNLANTIAVLESLTFANPPTGGSTVVYLSLGADAAGTRVIAYQIPQGVGTYTIYPMLRITGTTILQLSSDTTDGIVVCTGNGTVDTA